LALDTVLAVAPLFNTIFGFYLLFTFEGLGVVLTPWEGFIAGWALGFAAIGIASVWNRHNKSGKEAKKADEAFDAWLLSVFNVKASHAGTTNEWSYAIVSTLPGLLGMLILSWFNDANPELKCVQAPDAATLGNWSLSRQFDECPTRMHGSSASLVQQAQLYCCFPVSKTHDLPSSFAAIGGNVSFGYGFIKYVAEFLLLGADGVQENVQQRQDSDSAADPLLPDTPLPLSDHRSGSGSE
jgi:hypothetical protein